MDEETGNYYYRNRYYSARQGRFMSNDPIGYGDGLNMYAYVKNDPVNNRDPLGLMDDEEDDGGDLLEPELRQSLTSGGGGGGGGFQLPAFGFCLPGTTQIGYQNGVTICQDNYRDGGFGGGSGLAFGGGFLGGAGSSSGGTGVGGAGSSGSDGTEKDFKDCVNGESLNPDLAAKTISLAAEGLAKSLSAGGKGLEHVTALFTVDGGPIRSTPWANTNQFNNVNPQVALDLLPSTGEVTVLALVHVHQFGLQTFGFSVQDNLALGSIFSGRNEFFDLPDLQAGFVINASGAIHELPKETGFFGRGQSIIGNFKTCKVK